MLINILFYLTCFLFSLGQLGRISFYNQQINFYLYEIGLGLFLLILLIKYRFEPLKTVWKKYKIIFLFVFILFISLINGFDRYTLFENIVGLLYLLRLIFYGGYGVYAGYEVKENPHFRKTLRRGIIIITVITIITTITQYFLYPDLRNLFYLGWDPHLNRLFGLWFDTSTAAAVYGLIFLYFFENKSNIFLQILYLAFFILTFSRGAYVGIIIIMIINFITKKEYKKLLLFLSLFLIIFLISPKKFGMGVGLNRVFSIESRLNDYRQAISLWKKSPLIGIGYNRIRYLKNQDQAIHSGASFHSSYLIVLVATGMMGLMGFMGLMRQMWIIGKDRRYLILFLFIISLFDNILLHPFILFLLFSSLFDR